MAGNLLVVRRVVFPKAGNVCTVKFNDVFLHSVALLDLQLNVEMWRCKLGCSVCKVKSSRRSAFVNIEKENVTCRSCYCKLRREKKQNPQGKPLLSSE